MAYLDKQDKKKSDSKALPLLERIKNRYKGIRSELRKVIWPDRKHFKINLVTVLAIIMGAALIIFAFDALVSFVLRNLGFFNISEQAAAPIQATAAVTESVQTAETESAETETAEASTAESGN